MRERALHLKVNTNRANVPKLRSFGPNQCLLLRGWILPNVILLHIYRSLDKHEPTRFAEEPIMHRIHRQSVSQVVRNVDCSELVLRVAHRGS